MSDTTNTNHAATFTAPASGAVVPQLDPQGRQIMRCPDCWRVWRREARNARPEWLRAVFAYCATTLDDSELGLVRDLCRHIESLGG